MATYRIGLDTKGNPAVFCLGRLIKGETADLVLGSFLERGGSPVIEEEKYQKMLELTREHSKKLSWEFSTGLM